MHVNSITMSQDLFSRTQILIGEEAMRILANSRVAVFGIGGVGGYATEILARSGVGEIDIIDNDRIDRSNINRQLIALTSTIGRLKVDVMEERIKQINPDCIVHKHSVFYMPGIVSDIHFNQFDYVVDCIDTIAAKIDIIQQCHCLHIPIISCMGAANKMDPTAFKITDIHKTQMDPLAKVIRKKMRELHIRKLKVVYSEEQPLQRFISSPTTSSDISFTENKEPCPKHRHIPASNAFVPAAEGILAGSEVVKDLIKQIV